MGKDIITQIPGRDIFEQIRNSTSYFNSLVDDYCDKKEDVENNAEVISVQKLFEILDNFYKEYRDLKYYEYNKHNSSDFVNQLVDEINQDYQKVTSSKKGKLDKEKILFLLGNLFEPRREKSDSIRCIEAKGYFDHEYLFVYFTILKYGYWRRLTLIKINNVISPYLFDDKTNLEESEEFFNKYYEQIKEYFNLLEKKRGYIPQSKYLFVFPTYSVKLDDEMFTGTVYVDSSGEVRLDIKVKDDDSIIDFGNRSNMTDYINNNKPELLEKMPVRVSSIEEPLRNIVVSALEEEKKSLHI